jgi:cytochrome c|tara:strand:- start:57771 stop:58151 length:381 start_codon:yes stop_codon:yes gene_type:complete
MYGHIKFAIAAGIAAFLSVPALSAPDGAALFKTRCGACHWDPNTPGEKVRLGPSLTRLSGREAGTADFKRYSPAMKASNIVWGRDSLDEYLNDPRKTVKGTTMAFPGLKKPDERAAVISYVLRAGK